MHTPVLGDIVCNIYGGCSYVQLVPCQSKIISFEKVSKNKLLNNTRLIIKKKRADVDHLSFVFPGN